LTSYLFNDIPQIGADTIDNAWSTVLPTRSQNWNLSYSKIFSPALITDIRLTHVRNAFGVLSRQDFSLGSLGLDVNDTNSVREFGLSPHARITVNGFFVANAAIPTRDIVPTTHLNSTSGKEQLSVRPGSLPQPRQSDSELAHGRRLTFNGFASGNSAADFLLGQYNQYRQISPLVTRLRQTIPSLFVQDDVRLTRTLTLNLGLRWDPSLAWISENDVLSAFLPGVQSKAFPKMGLGLLYPGDAGLPRGIVDNRYNNFSPRAGFAWDARDSV